MDKKKSKKVKNEGCHFCESNSEPDYKEVLILRRFISDRGKVISAGRSGVCSKHQRVLSTAIKRSRFLALLPYTDQHSL